jgi:hypothetical protein
MFTPKLEILPAAQRTLWNELKDTPSHFVLYGGTALALRLGHRSSEDFDFFSNHSFTPGLLQKAIPFLRGAEVTQSEPNTLTAIVDRSGPTKISFFGALELNRVQDPDVAPDNRIQVASMLDVAATKMVTIQQRAQSRDYEDIEAILAAGISLAEALAAATSVYGQQFNGALSLKALTYFADGDLPQLNRQSQATLRTLASQVNLKQIPSMKARNGLTDEDARA